MINKIRHKFIKDSFKSSKVRIWMNTSIVWDINGWENSDTQLDMKLKFSLLSRLPWLCSLRVLDGFWETSLDHWKVRNLGFIQNNSAMTQKVLPWRILFGAQIKMLSKRVSTSSQMIHSQTWNQYKEMVGSLTQQFSRLAFGNIRILSVRIKLRLMSPTKNGVRAESAKEKFAMKFSLLREYD